MGDNTNDTGFLRLTNVRIPREHLLSRWQEVTPEGKYLKSEKKTNSKVHYATMVFTRGGMVRSAGGQLAKAVTNAIRYSCVRSQGFLQTKDTESFKSAERQVIDYGVQRYRLFKQLATAYAIKFIGGWMLTKFKDLNGIQLDNLEALPEIASSAAGLKGLCTFLAAQGIEDCRKCCGGHGYLLASGIATQAADYVWQTTAEGDFILMILQCSKFLVKTYNASKEGKPASGPCVYLSGLSNPNFKISSAAPVPARRFEEFLNPQKIIEYYHYRALVAVSSVAEEVNASIAKGMQHDDAWNSVANELANCVRAHCLSFILQTFYLQISSVEDKSCAAALTQVFFVFFVVLFIS